MIDSLKQNVINDFLIGTFHLLYIGLILFPNNIIRCKSTSIYYCQFFFTGIFMKTYNLSRIFK